MARRMETEAQASIQGGMPITLTGAYDLRWRDYSALSCQYGWFRYLAVDVS